MTTTVITPADAANARSADFTRRRQAVRDHLLSSFNAQATQHPERAVYSLSLVRYCEFGSIEADDDPDVVRLGVSDLFYDLGRAGWNVDVEVRGWWRKRVEVRIKGDA